jgi:hypothetical protein
MAGHAVGAEGQHRVGLHRSHHSGHPAYGLVLVDVGAPAVGIVEPVVLGDAEDRQRGLHLGRTHGRQLRPARPAFLVGRAQLAAGRGDADDVVAGPDRAGHQPGAQVALVVGVRPDAEDRAQGVVTGHVTTLDP